MNHEASDRMNHESGDGMNHPANDRVNSGVLSTKGRTGKLGIGSCTGGLEKSLEGCPPKAIDIIEFLKRNID
jgi:hypothetical protein